MAGDMDLQAMRDALQFDLEMLGNVTDPQRDRWINWTYRHVSQPRVFRHSELQTSDTLALVLNVPSYALTNVYYTDHVVYVAGPDPADLTKRRKRLDGPQSMRELEEGQYPAGEPVQYARWANLIYLNNRPGTTQVGHTILVRGYQRPALLVDPGDFTVLRPEFDEVLLVGAKWRGYRSLGRYDAAEVAKADFVDLLRDMQEQRVTEAEDWGGMFDPDHEPYLEM